MSSTPRIKAYPQATDPQSCAEGWVCNDKEYWQQYFSDRVMKRLKLSDATSALREYVARMPQTGFDNDALSRELTGGRRPQDWEIGEAFAEVIMEDHHECRYPWPTGKDRREDSGHPTGPDLPGFSKISSRHAFGFGEVKSSSEASNPPLAVSGLKIRGVLDPKKASLVSQVTRLLTDEQRRIRLIAWLQFRCQRDPVYGQVYDEAIATYQGATARAVIIGCLIRGGVQPHYDDLKDAAVTLSAISGPFILRLHAYYLPFKMEEWAAMIPWENTQS